MSAKKTETLQDESIPELSVDRLKTEDHTAKRVFKGLVKFFPRVFLVYPCLISHKS